MAGDSPVLSSPRGEAAARTLEDPCCDSDSVDTLDTSNPTLDLVLSPVSNPPSVLLEAAFAVGSAVIPTGEPEIVAGHPDRFDRTVIRLAPKISAAATGSSSYERSASSARFGFSPACADVAPTQLAFPAGSSSVDQPALDQTRPRCSSPGNDLPGQIGSYVVKRRIATGGMGIVYEATHACLGRRAAVKVLRRSLGANPELVQRFLGEAIAASRIRHSGVVNVYDFGHLEDGTAYLVMEYLEGQTLEKRLETGDPMCMDEVVDLGGQLARTLAHAHAEGVVHRDLKPDNIFLSLDPTRPRGVRTKVLDFGVAKLLRENALASAVTEIGRILGTPWYMSPEQCRSAADVDHRSDIYALGCVLYQLACGRVPFPGTLSEVILCHLNAAPNQPAAVNPGVPPALEQLILRMMAKDPADRPQTMDEVAQALADLALTAAELAKRSPRPSTNPSVAMAVAVDHTRQIASRPSSVHERPRSNNDLWEGTEPVIRRRAGRRLGPVALCVAAVLLGVVSAVALSRADGGSPAPEISVRAASLDSAALPAPR